jgi:Cap4 SAVED domain
MTSGSRAQRPPFFEVRIHDLAAAPPLTGVCAGYESQGWRCDQLASHLITLLPDFALTYEEKEGLNSDNAAEKFVQAAKSVYTSKGARFRRRGEAGELLLHAICREVFNTLPAIARYYYKDSANDTVKGFDLVHVRASSGGLELWLGESKLYRSIGRAIAAVVKDLRKHTRRDYLRGEFMAITNKIEDGWPHAARLKRLLDPRVSLDQIFERVCIPVLLTYESSTIRGHQGVTQAFKLEFEREVRKHHGAFAERNKLRAVRVHLVLLPIHTKAKFLKAFDERLSACQSVI